MIDPDLDPAWVAKVREHLVAWYDDGHRDLPWRRDRDPYRVLVSEAMLVQTTVAAVLPYYERFLARFPTAEALAGADEAEVLKAWEGLGYYRRARQLQEAARAIVRDHGGTFPDDPEAVRALPGVGRYIAGAILSFAYDRPAPIVEANTQRVLARLLAWEGAIGTSATQKRLWEAAERLVPPEGAGRFNQAIMELGAVVCTPRSPMCLVCPVAAECRARARGLQDALPIKAAKASPREVSEACAVVEREGRLLVVRRGPGRLWADFWEFPTIHRAGADPAGRSFGAPIELAEGVRRLTGVRAEVGSAVRTLRFGVTNHRVELTAHEATYLEGEPRPGPGLVEASWVEPGALADLTMGSAQRRLVATLDRPAHGRATRGRRP
jgi:A/G-specific adenine glycosylase